MKLIHYRDRSGKKYIIVTLCHSRIGQIPVFKSQLRRKQEHSVNGRQIFLLNLLSGA